MNDAPTSPGAESSTGSSTADAEHLMRAIVELGSEGVWSIDAAAKTTFVNRAMAEMLGYAEHEMLGRSLFDFMDDEGRAIAQRNVARRREGIAERHDFRFVHRDGHAVFATLNTQPDEGPNGEYLGAIATVTDVTARRETDARFAALFEYSTDIITVLGPDGSWRYSSPAGTRLLGYEPGINPEGGVFSLIHPDDVAGAVAGFADAASGARDRDELIMLRVRAADGSWRMFETVATNLVNDPAVGGIVLNSRDVTDRVQVEEALRASEARFRALVQHSSDVIVVLDSEARVAYVSPAGDRILGRAPEETVGIVGTDLVHPDDLDQATAALAELVTTPGSTTSVTVRVACADGTYRALETIGHNFLEDPAIGGIVLNARDITDRIEAERRAAQLLDVLERSEEVVVLSDPDGHVVYANQHARTFAGLTESHHFGEVLSLEARVRLREVVMPIMRRHGLWTGELMLRAGDGGEVPVLATVQAHREDGDIVLVSMIAHDITKLKEAQHHLEYQATRDTLTGLPNRANFNEAGEQALERAARHRSVTAVLFLDLDGFKAVNDSLGHATGDRALVEVAERLRVGLRGGDIVARIGGDEFCVLCERVSGAGEMRELGQRLIDAISVPLRIDGTDFALSASIGAALSEPGTATIESLVDNADVALYRAKRAGRGLVDVFDPGAG
jgi:diguanylate cyclase (GGDEF)-like protein/PAS domain S-box-containing protein